MLALNRLLRKIQKRKREGRTGGGRGSGWAVEAQEARERTAAYGRIGKNQRGEIRAEVVARF